MSKEARALNHPVVPAGPSPPGTEEMAHRLRLVTVDISCPQVIPMCGQGSGSLLFEVPALAPSIPPPMKYLCPAVGVGNR